MIGRIELVTPGQRNLLREISGFSPNEIRQEAGQLATNYFGRFLSGMTNGAGDQQMSQLNRDMAQVNAGQKPLAAYVSVPRTYQTYLDLGRFRNALILDEARVHPTEGLTNFIATYRLQAWHPVEPAPHP